MKEYNFLIGVPRAGNTVISSLLNQNKNLCLTANSPLSGLLYELDLLRYFYLFHNPILSQDI